MTVVTSHFLNMLLPHLILSQFSTKSQNFGARVKNIKFATMERRGSEQGQGGRDGVVQGEVQSLLLLLLQHLLHVVHPALPLHWSCWCPLQNYDTSPYWISTVTGGMEGQILVEISSTWGYHIIWCKHQPKVKPEWPLTTRHIPHHQHLRSARMSIV